jgi:ketosteroid isomerase-like protein
MTEPATANDRSDPEICALLDLMEEYRRALDYGDGPFDREAVSPLYRQDDSFTAYDLAPPTGGYIGWDAYAAGWYRIMNKYSHFRFLYNDDLRVFRKGDVAWASVSFRVTGRSAGGEAFDKDGRVTLVWARENGKWLIVHEHVSSPRITPSDR